MDKISAVRYVQTRTATGIGFAAKVLELILLIEMLVEFDIF